MRTRHSLFPLLVLGAVSVAAGGDHTVAPGETLSEIAAEHATTTTTLAQLNSLTDPNRILAGQALALPTGASTPSSAAATDRAGAEALIERTARAHGWSPAFVKAIAWQESGWDQTRVSHAGAVGVMQVMPATGEFISNQLVGRQLDLHDPEDNVLAGVVYLQHLWQLTGGDVEQTLAGYYQGLRSVADNGRYQDTERYIANVLALRERFR